MEKTAQTASLASMCHLNELSVLDITGEDAQAFLQAQLTSDVKALAISDAQYTAYCTPKGRMLANGYLIRIAEHQYWWVMDRSILDRLLKRLSMFILRSKVKLIPQEIGCYGVVEGNTLQTLQTTPQARPDTENSVATIRVIRTSAQAVVLALPQQRTLYMYLETNTAASASLSSRLEWDIASIAADEVLVTQATCEELIPQMIEWDRLGGVSFKKGCYPGQEIVARSHYLGKMKRRLFKAAFSDALQPETGAPIVSEDEPNQSAGLVVRTAQGPKGGVLLAVLSTDLVNTESHLHLHDTTTPATLSAVSPRFPLSSHTK